MLKILDHHLRQINEAYQGEVYGEAMYQAMADAYHDTERKWPWLVLVQLEVETKRVMRGLLLELGLSTNESVESRQAGLHEAARIKDMPWQDMIIAFAADLPEMIVEYSKLRADLRAVGFHHEAISRLVEHEVVTLAFCERELAGGANSIAPVLAMLEEPPPLPKVT